MKVTMWSVQRNACADDTRFAPYVPKTSPVKAEIPTGSLLPTSCSICLEPYDQPKVLPCLHTFCKSCLVKLGGGRGRENTKGFVSKSMRGKGRSSSTQTQSQFTSHVEVPDQPSMLQGSVEITCPLCKAVHSTQVELLPTHYSLQQEVAIQALTSREQRTAICNQCEEIDRAPFGYCPQCRSFICQSCYNAHQRMKTFKSHSVVPMADFDPKILTTDIYCPDHKEQLLSYYCRTCGVSVCPECPVGKHCKHEIVTMKDGKEEVTGSMRTLHTEVSVKLQEFKDHLELITKIEAHMSQHQKYLTAEVNKACDTGLKNIEAARMSLLSKIDDTCGQESKKIWAEKDTVERAILGQESCLAFTERLLKSTDDTEVVYLSSQGLRQLKVLKESNWNAKSINPTFMTFKDKIPNTVGDVAILEGSINCIKIQFPNTIQFYPHNEYSFSVIAEYCKDVFNSPAVTVKADITNNYVGSITGAVNCSQSYPQVIPGSVNGRHYQQFTTGAGNYQQVMTGAGNYQQVMTGAGNYQQVMTGAGNYQQVMTGAGNYQQVMTGAVKCKIGNYDSSRNCWDGVFSCGSNGTYTLTVSITAGKAVGIASTNFNVTSAPQYSEQSDLFW